MNQEKKAILVVSFGTSFEHTRKKTIDAIEGDIKKVFKDYTVYSAWTSNMILKKILHRDGIKRNTVTEAMETILKDGFKEVLVAPTHILNGIENDLMKKDALAFSHQFDSITFSDPLLTSTEDLHHVIKTISTEYSHLDKDTALVFMGHGTNHYVNPVYAALDYMFKASGHPEIFIGTVEAYPELDLLIEHVKSYAPKKICLAPFMIVAGDHAENDMASDEPDSWKIRFQKEGYEVNCNLIGLGEYQGIRDLFLEHIRTAL